MLRVTSRWRLAGAVAWVVIIVVDVATGGPLWHLLLLLSAATVLAHAVDVVRDE